MSAIARWCFARRRVVVVFWVVLLAGLAAGVLAKGSHFAGNAAASNTESGKAAALLQQALAWVSTTPCSSSTGTARNCWRVRPWRTRAPARWAPPAAPWCSPASP